MATSRLHKPRDLTAREWYCVLIASHFAAGRRQPTLAIMKKGIKEDRLPERMFSELFLQLSLLLGFPTMLEGLAMLRSIAGKSPSRSRRTASEQRATVEGRKVLERIYGSAVDRLLLNLKSMHDIVPNVILRDVYGRILCRPGLTLRERELVNVAVLSIQRLDQQLYSHVRGAIRVRAGRNTLRSTIILAARIAGISPAKSLQLLHSIRGSEFSGR